MMSKATFTSLLERGDILVKDGATYRPLSVDDAQRRMYIRTGDIYTMLAFTASGADGPAPVLPTQRVSIDLVGSATDAVTQIDRAVKPVSEVVKGCGMAWLVIMGIIVGGLMLLILLFGDEGSPGLVQENPGLVVGVAFVVIVLLVARRKRRR